MSGAFCSFGIRISEAERIGGRCGLSPVSSAGRFETGRTKPESSRAVSACAERRAWRLSDIGQGQVKPLPSSFWPFDCLPCGQSKVGMTKGRGIPYQAERVHDSHRFSSPSLLPSALGFGGLRPAFFAATPAFRIGHDIARSSRVNRLHSGDDRWVQTFGNRRLVTHHAIPAIELRRQLLGLLDLLFRWPGERHVADGRAGEEQRQDQAESKDIHGSSPVPTIWRAAPPDDDERASSLEYP